MCVCVCVYVCVYVCVSGDDDKDLRGVRVALSQPPRIHSHVV